MRNFTQFCKASFLAIFIFIIQCKNPGTVAESDEKPQISETCYLSLQEGDEISMSLAIHETHVSGSLYFAVKNKEQSVGTYSGVIKGEMMYIQYKFATQDSGGVRDLIFERKTKTLSEKTIQLQDGKDTKYISTGVVLNKIECVRDEKGCMANFGYAWSEQDKKCLDRTQRSQKIREASTTEQK